MRKRHKPSEKPGIRLRHLEVRNFRALDEFHLELPPPRVSGEQDVFVMGSRNGLGKTSVLESCALLYVMGTMPSKAVSDLFMGFSPHEAEPPIDLLDLMVRAGESAATVKGVFETNGTRANVLVKLARGTSGVSVSGDTEVIRKSLSQPELLSFDSFYAARTLLYSLAGMNSEPLVLPPLMYFHSYRKVQEGNPELGMMVEPYRSRRRRAYRTPLGESMGTFKLTLLRSLMSQTGLFEGPGDSEGAEALEMLNGLMEQYAGGRIEKLRPSPDNTLEFRVSPPGPGAKSFGFDGLSSGQKEIISTLFLIWRYTHAAPGILLIDEPELHLNPEWHAGFLNRLHEMVPSNQCIAATHSEDVFGSVDPSRRILLEPAGSPKP